MPRIGDILLYTNRHGNRYPAVVTGTAQDGPGLHLHQLPPPGIEQDLISYQYGAAPLGANPTSGWTERDAQS